MTMFFYFFGNNVRFLIVDFHKEQGHELDKGKTEDKRQGIVADNRYNLFHHKDWPSEDVPGVKASIAADVDAKAGHKGQETDQQQTQVGLLEAKAIEDVANTQDA